MIDSALQLALDKAAAGGRLDREEACRLANCTTPNELHLLGKAALANRRMRFGNKATYVFNLHVNPSNICEGGCSFCRYSARPNDPHAYVLNAEEILKRIRQVQPSEVHIVGGLNHIWNFKRSADLIKGIRSEHPDIFIKAFTAVEIDWFARNEGISWRDVIISLKESGLEALAGGGAEIFSERIRRALCPEKISGEKWLEIHEIAHSIGLTTNATMLYGIGETPSERAGHLLALRELQDRTGGFNCFIPLAWQNDNGGPAAGENLAAIALSRLILDNFPHIKAYWVMIGLETASAGLSWGADDLDGTLGEERIAHAAGAQSPKSVTRRTMRDTIINGGFVPVERGGRFETREPRMNTNDHE